MRYILILITFFINLSASNLQWQLNYLIKKGAPKWMQEQIAQDLKKFKNSGITLQMLDKTIASNAADRCFVRYQIKNNKIIVKFADKLVISHSVVNDYFREMTEILQELSLLVRLPNIEFILFPSDGPGEVDKYLAPVLSFCKRKNDHKIIVLIPDPQSISYSKNDILEQVNQGNNKYPWNKKISKGFWRGASTGAYFTMQNFKTVARVKLVDLSIKNPSMYDARFTSLVQMDENVKQEFIGRGYFDNSVSISEHMKYKYQILIDGNTSSWGRGYWQLFSNSLILKQESPWTLWYYNAIKPFQHYVPFDYEIDNITAQISWAKNNEKKVIEIIRNANIFALQNLSYTHMLYYIYLVLTEYAKLQKFII